MKNGDWFVCLRAGRYGGAPVLGKYVGASLAECDNLIADDAEGINERYYAALNGGKTLDTIGGLLATYESSDDFEATKSASTKAAWSLAIASIKASALGKAKASILKQPAAPGVIAKWRDKEARERGPRAASYRLEVLTAALNWNLRQGNIAKNPAALVADTYRADRSDLIWEREHVEGFRAYVKTEIDRVWLSMRPGPKRYAMIRKLVNAHDTLTTALNTGMRRGDLAAFAWIHVQDGAIIYTPQKGRNRARTSNKPARTVVLPILPEVARMLARRREAMDGPKVLGGYTAHSQGHLVADLCKLPALNIDRHLHDAKGTFVTRLKIHTDLTNQEIAELVDWSLANVQSIIKRYVSGAAVSDALLKRFRREA